MPRSGCRRWRPRRRTSLTGSNCLPSKSGVFFVAFLPRFIRPGEAVARQRWILALTFAVMATLNATLCAVFAAAARRLLSSARAAALPLGGRLAGVGGWVWALLARRPT